MARIPISLPICIDGRMLVPGATGVARYAATLSRTIPLVGGRPMILRDHDDGRLPRWIAALTPGARRARVEPGVPEVLRGDHLFRAAQVRFGLCGRFMTVAADAGPGVMHWTYPVPMRMAGWANVYTVHDVIPLDRPEWGGVDPRRLRAILDRIVASGDMIATVSDHARARIVARTGIDPARVVNAGQAVEPEAGPGAPLPFGLMRGRYILYCGLAEPRKNLDRLVAGWRRSGTGMTLVLAGPGAMPAGAGIVRTGHVADAVLADLREGAAMLAMPSLAEGFGLPVVEAMAVGTPVLTSATGALAEVAGDAALLVDPEDVGAIADGIARLAADAGLRARLSAAGRARAARFGRARHAARLRALYARAIAAAGIGG